MIKKEIINQAIEYIMTHLDQDLSAESVAEHFHFSKYYFSHMFKAETGESLYSFMKRLKMDQSAFRLKVEQERSITEISSEYGYSSSNFCSAFRQRHHISPARFREEISAISAKHPFYPGTENHLDTYEECCKKVTIEHFPEVAVIYERRIGNYQHLGSDWCEFLDRYQSYQTEHSLLMERTYDDASITDADSCLYDICMSIEKDCGLENTMIINGGKFAVYHFSGYPQQIYSAYQSMFQVWLPAGGYRIDNRYGFDIYHEIDCGTMYMEMDICIPVV